MTTAEQDRYILHLNQALAMESALVDHLEKRAQEVPTESVKLRIQQHRQETIQHRDTVRRTIQTLGGEPTATKATVQPPIAPGVAGRVISALEREPQDRRLGEDLADFAVEHYEAGLYAVLARIARNLGYHDQAAQFEQIRQEEIHMAEFIESSAPFAVDTAFPPKTRAA